MLRAMITASRAVRSGSTIITSESEGFLSDLDERYLTFKYKKGGARLPWAVRYLRAHIAMLWLVARAIKNARSRQSKPVVVCNTHLVWPSALLAYCMGERVVWYVHETSLRPKLLSWMMRRSRQITSHLSIFPSEFLWQRESSQNRLTVVVPNCLDPEFTNSLGWSCSHKKRQALFVGSLVFYKGFKRLCQIARNCTEVTFIAALSNTAEEIAEHLASHGHLPANLKIYSRPKNLRYLYAESLVVMNLTDTFHWLETFGLTILEGMSQGCFFVAPEDGGHREFCDLGEGLLVKAEDTARIAQYIIDVAAQGDAGGHKCSSKNRGIAMHYSFEEYQRSLNSVLTKNL